LVAIPAALLCLVKYSDKLRQLFKPLVDACHSKAPIKTFTSLLANDTNLENQTFEEVTPADFDYDLLMSPISSTYKQSLAIALQLCAF
jgi:hypothetical protein